MTTLLLLAYDYSAREARRSLEAALLNPLELSETRPDFSRNAMIGS